MKTFCLTQVILGLVLMIPICESRAFGQDSKRIPESAIKDIRAIASTELGPTLGISAGFNSLDGD